MAPPLSAGLMTVSCSRLSVCMAVFNGVARLEKLDLMECRTLEVYWAEFCWVRSKQSAERVRRLLMLTMLWQSVQCQIDMH